jgi:uncharacterized membrane protein (DUF2068 family)
VDWSLLGCALSGHLTYAPDETDVRERLMLHGSTGEAWQCLRCAAFVPGEPQMSGPAAAAPPVKRDKELRGTLILRVFAVERFLRAIAVAALAILVWRLEYSRHSIEQAFDREIPILRELFQQFGYNIDRSKLVGFIHEALTLSPTTIRLLAIALAVYAAVEVAEGTGLWLARRWGEYFAMVATSLGIPYEIYDLVSKVTATRLVLFAINLALVFYLVISKRLFGARGGKHAYEARLRSESIMQSAIDAAAAAAASHPPAADKPAANRPAAAADPGQDQPPADQDQPPAGQDQPPAGQDQPPAGQDQPPAGQDQPAADRPSPDGHAPAAPADEASASDRGLSARAGPTGRR